MSLTRHLVKIARITSIGNSLLPAPMFLVSGPPAAIQLAKGPVVTRPSPFPRKDGDQIIDLAGFGKGKSRVESQ